MNITTGEIDQERLKANLQAANDVYIERCNHAPCGDTQIVLFQGADSSNLQKTSPDLITLLKGSSKAMMTLKKEKADLYAKFEMIWAVREWNILKRLQSQYPFSFSLATQVTAHILCARMVNSHLQLPCMTVAHQLQLSFTSSRQGSTIGKGMQFLF